MRVSTKSLVVFLLLMYMTLLSLNGVVTVAAYMSTRALLLYKDFFAMAVPVFVLILLFARNPNVSKQCRSVMIFFLSMVIFSLVYVLLSMITGRFDFFRSIVQFRLELLTFGSFSLPPFYFFLNIMSVSRLLIKSLSTIFSLPY